MLTSGRFVVQWFDREKIVFFFRKGRSKRTSNFGRPTSPLVKFSIYCFLQFEADLTIKHYNASISSLEHCRELLEVEDIRLEDDVNELKQDFMLQQQIKLNNQQREFSVRQW